MATSNGNPNQSLVSKDIFQISQKKLESRALVEIVLESILAGSVVFLAVFGNILTIYIVYKNRALRTSTNMFAVSLAVADMFMGLTVVMMALVVIIKSSWIFDSGSCHFQSFMIVFCSSISLMTITMTSVNRFFKVVKNSLYQRYFTKKRTAIMIVCSWICGVVIAAPVLLPGATVFIPFKLVCFVDITKDEWKFYVVAAMSTVVVIPVLVVPYCYLRIFLKVTYHQSNVFQSRQNTASLQEIKITRMMFAIVLCFSICWTPAYIINMIDCARATFTLHRAAYLIHSFGAGISCGINPILYGLMNPTFRREYMKVLRCWKSNGNNAIEPTTHVPTCQQLENG